MSTSLQLIGYWAADLRDEYFLPQDFIREMPRERQRQIADYLDSGQYADGYRGYSWCRICGKQNGSAELSDGEWIWPEGLSHYVRVHSVTVPDEIIANACNAERDPRPSVRLNVGKSTEFWLAWCASHSSGVMSPFLEWAMIGAGVAANKVIAEIARKKAAQFGVSSIPCGKKTCDRMSISKHYYCAPCDTEQYRESLTNDCYSVWPAITAHQNSKSL